MNNLLLIDKPTLTLSSKLNAKSENTKRKLFMTNLRNFMITKHSLQKQEQDLQTKAIAKRRP
jgi:hypothetical protein